MTRLRPRALIGVVVLGIAAFGATVLGQRITWPVPVQRVPDIVPALSPADEMKTLFLPPGYHVELVAAEPLVKDPIWIDFDADGRMYVVEMTGFAIDKTLADSREPIGSVVVLDDTNDDGKMDKLTVFMDGLVLPRAVKALANGVL